MKPPSPKQRGHRVGQREGRVAGSEWEWVLGIVCACPLNYKCLLALPPPPLPTLWLTLSLTLIYPPILSFSLSFCSSWMKRNVWQGLATKSIRPHICFPKNQKQGLIKQRSEAVGICTPQLQIDGWNSHIQIESQILNVGSRTMSNP